MKRNLVMWKIKASLLWSPHGLAQTKVVAEITASREIYTITETVDFLDNGKVTT